MTDRKTDAEAGQANAAPIPLLAASEASGELDADPETTSPGEARNPDACALAIDPGRAKCGVAVVRQDGRVLYRGIVPVESVSAQVAALIAD